jgi:hypothetical protein
MDRELQRMGFTTRWSLPPSTKGMDKLIEVLRPAGGQRMLGMTISVSGMHQCLYELVQPRRYAEAVREMFDWSVRKFPTGRTTRGQPPVRLGQVTMAFANEKAVWLKRPKAG